MWVRCALGHPKQARSPTKGMCVHVKRCGPFVRSACVIRVGLLRSAPTHCQGQITTCYYSSPSLLWSESQSKCPEIRGSSFRNSTMVSKIGFPGGLVFEAQLEGLEPNILSIKSPVQISGTVTAKQALQTFQQQSPPPAPSSPSGRMREEQAEQCGRRAGTSST